MLCVIAKQAMRFFFSDFAYKHFWLSFLSYRFQSISDGFVRILGFSFGRSSSTQGIYGKPIQIHSVCSFFFSFSHFFFAIQSEEWARESGKLERREVRIRGKCFLSARVSTASNKSTLMGDKQVNETRRIAETEKLRLKVHFFQTVFILCCYSRDKKPMSVDVADEK